MKRWSPFGPLRYLSGETRGLARDSSLLGVGQGATTQLKVGDTMLITAGGGRRPTHIDAPLVFIGYGLHLPGKGGRGHAAAQESESLPIC